jgi:chromosomal replication initiator protein
VNLSWLSTLRVFLAHGSRDFFRHKTLSLLNLLALAVGVGAIVAIQTVNDMMETDTSFRNAVNELKKKFKMRSY